jgi:preprotein translocase subunit SecB
MTDENKVENKDENKDEDQAKKHIGINKIYLKDFSFESPQAPAIFRSGEWKPQTNLNLRSSHNDVEGDLHEVVLTITVDAKDGDTTLFLVEIQQSGLFEIAGYGKEELSAIVGSFCPNVLFPYARESIAAVIQKGGFPEFVLQPINFDALYHQSRQQAAQVEAEGTEKH